MAKPMKATEFVDAVDRIARECGLRVVRSRLVSLPLVLVPDGVCGARLAAPQRRTCIRPVKRGRCWQHK